MNMIIALALLVAVPQADQDNVIGNPIGQAPGPVTNLSVFPLNSITIQLSFNSPTSDPGDFTVPATTYQVFALPNPSATLVQAIQGPSWSTVNLEGMTGALICDTEPPASAPGVRDDIVWTNPLFYAPNPAHLVAVQVKTYGAQTQLGAPNPIQLVTMPTDSTAPGMPQALALSETQVAGTVHLEWNAPGDDNMTGLAWSYEVRMSNSPITSNAAFAAATPVSDAVPYPGSPGSTDEMFVPNVTIGVVQYFAIRASDEVGNVSPVAAGSIILFNFFTSPVGTSSTSRKGGSCSAGASSASLLLPLLIGAALLRSRTLQS